MLQMSVEPATPFGRLMHSRKPWMGAAMSDTTFGFLLLMSGLLAGAAIVVVSRLAVLRASRQWIRKNRRQ